MSDQAAARATRARPAPAAPAAAVPADPAAQSRISELRVSGHTMTLDRGLFCLFHTHSGHDASGLPGVRISAAPTGRPGAVTIATFRDDGWLAGGDDGALVRVSDAQAQILVTVYQSPSHSPDQAPRLQVVKVSGEPAGAPREPAATPEMVAHIQRAGDVGGQLGEWLGVRGSKAWIEGFGLAPREKIKPEEIEYQAVLGRGWLSPWSEGGKFCGSRGMALPLLGIRVRLKGEAAQKYDLTYAATFVDGAAVGPVEAEEACEADSLAALEAFQIVLTPKGAAKTAPAKRPVSAPRAVPAAAPSRAKPMPVPPKRGR